MKLLSLIFILFTIGCKKDDESDNNLEDNKIQFEVLYNTEYGAIKKSEDKAEYAKGDKVTLTAEPKDGFKFEKWILSKKQEVTENPINLTLESDSTITAVFISKSSDKLTLTVTCNKTEGVITNKNETTIYNNGDNIELSALANTGYVFKHWIISGQESTISVNPLKLPINKNMVISAVFEAASYKVNAIFNNIEGNISINPVKEIYMAGELITISATPKKGFIFENWEGINAENKEVTIQVNQHLDIKANFKAVRPSLVIVGKRVKLKDGYSYLFDVDFAPMTSKNDKARLFINNTEIERFEYGEVKYKDLTPGEKITIKFEHSSLSEPLVVEAIVPPNFPDTKTLLFKTTGEEFKMQWGKMNCDGYIFNQRLAHDNGIYPYDRDDFLYTMSNQIDIDSKYLLNHYPYSTGGYKIKYFAVSVSPANKVDNFDGFTSNSKVLLKGSVNSWMTNLNNYNFWTSSPVIEYF